MSGAPPLPHKQRLKSDIVAEPITAYRAWRIGHQTPTLTSETPEFRLMAWAVANIEWSKGANKAKCIGGLSHFWEPEPHRPPDPLCKCGFWAFRSEEELSERINIGSQPNRNQYAWGKIKIWGRIIEGARNGRVGYRAEYAKPEEIVIVRPYDTLRDIIPEQIASHYEVKVSLGGDPKRASLPQKGIKTILEKGKW